jgi:hypothetical protein
MREKTIFFILTILTVANCFGQTDSSKKQARSVYSNWISLDYKNCLRTGLPCECEKSNEYFLISLDTTKKSALFYDGRANYDYRLYDIKKVSKTNFEVYNEQYSQTLLKDTIAVIGHLKLKNDTLLFIEAAGKQTKYILYSTGEEDGYFKEHIKLLNAALTIRGYDDLYKTLQSDSLKCWCNWELDGGISIIYGQEKKWILEKKDNELNIYEWTNPPRRKTIDLKIEKKLIKKLKW